VCWSRKHPPGKCAGGGDLKDEIGEKRVKRTITWGTEKREKRMNPAVFQNRRLGNKDQGEIVSTRKLRNKEGGAKVFVYRFALFPGQ